MLPKAYAECLLNGIMPTFESGMSACVSVYLFMCLHACALRYAGSNLQNLYSHKISEAHLIV